MRSPRALYRWSMAELLKMMLGARRRERERWWRVAHMAAPHYRRTETRAYTPAEFMAAMGWAVEGETDPLTLDERRREGEEIIAEGLRRGFVTGVA